MSRTSDRFGSRSSSGRGRRAGARRGSLRGSWSCAVVLALLAAAPAAQEYLVAPLDSNNVTSFCLAYAANSDGLAAGWATAPGFAWEQASVWSSHGTQLLATLPGDTLGHAYDVNDAGVVVGETDLVTQQGQLTFFVPHGVVWPGGPAGPGGPAVPLASLMASGASTIQPWAGLAVNNRGQILGWGKLPDLTGAHGFLLEDGLVTDLGNLAGSATGSTEPSDLNELGLVVGSSEAPDFFDHAFVWQDGVMTDLHETSGVPGRNSHARSINELGVIVGSADFVADFIDFETACMWVEGRVTNFGSLGGSQAFAHAINDHGTIVGTSITADNFVHAIIIRDGVMTDLNTLIPPGTGWVLANAYDIGNDGVIVGEGFAPDGLKAFSLVPNGDGTFEVYGAGCAGSLGITPALHGQGAPTSGGAIDLALVNGVGGNAALLLLGTGTGILPFKPGCDLQVLPLLSASLPLVLGGAGGTPGAGFWQISATLPPALPAFDLTLQALLADGGAPFGATVSNPLLMSVQ